VVGFDNEVLEVCLGPEGLISGAQAGDTIAICSTVRLSTIRALDSVARESGINLLDAPLCRAERAAVSGELLVLVGGSAHVFHEALPALSAFATDVKLLGGIGAGQIGKMVNNYLLWAAVVANHEGMRVAQAAGLPLDDFREALVLSSGDNWALRTWDQARPMPWADKDMAILLHAASELDLSMPMADSVRRNIKRLRRNKEAWRTAAGIQSGGAADSMAEYVKNTSPGRKGLRQGSD
jgi:3-hydroxyisobutyrate dehydrogenase-like beta-hydroxyacid dehydrogenase